MFRPFIGIRIEDPQSWDPDYDHDPGKILCFPSPDIYPPTSDGAFGFIKTRPRVIQLACTYRQSNKADLFRT